MIHIPKHKKIFLWHKQIRGSYLYKINSDNTFICCNNSRFDGYAIENEDPTFHRTTKYTYSLSGDDESILRCLRYYGFKMLLETNIDKLEIL